MEPSATTSAGEPVACTERIGAVDVIRGFALFGVLWMNLFAHGGQIAVPQEVIDALPTAPVDKVVGFITEWVADGKAQCLFSLLFGFGFAVMMERLDARGAKATGIYLRRLTVLLVLGFAHLWLVWWGDILHTYAMMGFVLVLTRRWPGWLLLTLGVMLCVLQSDALRIWALFNVKPGTPPPWVIAFDAGLAERWVVFRGHDYGAYVRALFSSSWKELYGTPIGLAFLAQVIGRFMIGSWVHARGWLQNPDAHAGLFRRAARICLPLGLLLAAVWPATPLLIHNPPQPWKLPLSLTRGLAAPLGQLLLALGYGAMWVLLVRAGRVKWLTGALGAVGQMALTNYLCQSLVYMFVLYGFGLGLLPWTGPTFCLGLAVVVFIPQMIFSVYWLKVFRFGPAEWLWRSATYGRWQPWLRA